MRSRTQKSEEPYEWLNKWLAQDFIATVVKALFWGFFRT